MVHKSTKSSLSIPINIVVGLIIGVIAAVVCIVITSILIMGETIGEQYGIYGAAAGLLFAGFCGTLFAIKDVKEKRIMICLIFCVVLITLFLCVTVVFFEGRFSNIWTSVLMIVGGCLAAGCLNNSGKSTSFKRKRIRTNGR